MSVAGRDPDCSHGLGGGLRFRVAIPAIAAAISASASSSPLRAVARMPVPRGLVRTSRSPGGRRRWSSIRAGSTRPVTARPYFGSSSSPCGRRRSPPPPRSPFPRRRAGSATRTPTPSRQGGKPTRLRAVSGVAAHGVDVREGVGRGDAAVARRVVDHRREEVDGLHQRAIFVEAVDPGIGKGDRGGKEGRVIEVRQLTQHLRQRPGGQLGGSAAAAGQGWSGGPVSRPWGNLLSEHRALRPLSAVSFRTGAVCHAPRVKPVPRCCLPAVSTPPAHPLCAWCT